MSHPLSILLVDDDVGDVRSISRHISNSGLLAECSNASGVAEAMDLCASRRFDCAIVDYQLPGQDGLQALLTFGKNHSYLPLVMSTGHGDEAVATEAMKRGASDYIRKSDISPSSIRRAIENAVEKTALHRKLAEQQQELARFADVLVHDLRAPSSSIQSFVWEIQDAVRDGNLDAVGQYCEWAANAAARMGALISTLYQYTLADGEVVFAPVDMNTVLDDTLAGLHTVIKDSSAVITRGDLPEVVGSKALLEQMLQNLISNGIKYCREPVARVHIKAEAGEGGTFIFSVSDNGIGIPEQDRARVFESFTRLHGVGEFAGTGLGLATCRKIVMRHGGKIWCESVTGCGTTFYFTLQSTCAVSAQALLHAESPKPSRAA